VQQGRREKKGRRRFQRKAFSAQGADAGGGRRAGRSWRAQGGVTNRRMFATIAHFNFGEHSPAHHFRKDVGARAQAVGLEDYAY